MKQYLEIRRLTFEQLLAELKPRLDFHVKKHRGKIPGFDDDDIRQELSIELWRKLDKLPPDMIYLDYRFTRFLETVFNRRIDRLYRNQFVSRRLGEHRDTFTVSYLVDDMENIVDS